MATLPADRTKLALAQSNQNPLNVLGSSQNKNALTEAYDTLDLLFNTMNGLISAAQLSKLGIINVKDYNASGSANTYTGSITSGTTTLTLVTSSHEFVAGQGISIPGAGAAAATLVTTVSAVNGAAITVAASAGTTASAVTVSHDDSVAIKTAIQAAVNANVVGQNIPVYFPWGNYSIRLTGVFSSITNTFRGGIKFMGAGWMNSIINLIPTGSPIWLYDNGVNNSRFQFCTFTDLKFTTSDNVNGNGFKLWSGGHEQGFKFTRCILDSFNIMFETDGAVGNSEHKFEICKITQIKNRVFSINNPQAVNFELFGCDVETIYGDIFYVDAAGGGSVKVYGGSFILSDNGTTDHFVVNNQGGSNSGPGNGDFNFFGTKFEMIGVYCKLVNNSLTAGISFINFLGCNFFTNSGGTREAVVIGPAKTVIFDRCFIPQEFTYRFVLGNLSYGNNGDIRFLNCRIPENLNTLFTTDSGYGSATARDCTSISGSIANAIAINFEFNWVNRTRGDLPVQLKSVVIKPANMQFPRTANADEYTMLLPLNAIIKNIHVRKPAGGDANPYQLFVGSNDKSIIYGQSVSATQAAEHLIHVADLFKEVTNVTNLQTVRLWMTGGGSSFITGGYAFIEYY